MVWEVTRRRKGEVLLTEKANPSGGRARRTVQVQMISTSASAGWLLGAPAAPKSREGDARRGGGSGDGARRARTELSNAPAGFARDEGRGGNVLGVGDGGGGQLVRGGERSRPIAEGNIALGDGEEREDAFTLLGVFARVRLHESVLAESAREEQIHRVPCGCRRRVWPRRLRGFPSSGGTFSQKLFRLPRRNR